MNTCYGYFLGTASIPTPDRNSQSTLLELPEGKILIDCGEGTMRQMLCHCGSCENLLTVFLTHHHIDHIYGIGGVVYGALQHTNLKVLRIAGPQNAIQNARSLIEVVGSHLINRLEWLVLVHGSVITSESYECICFHTFHTDDSLGYAFRIGKAKLSFLGDVSIKNGSAIDRICPFVSESDILVSDATHIEASEAATIAKRAKVKKLYLLPVSWDYPEHISRDSASKIFPNVSVPRDMDSFSFNL